MSFILVWTDRKLLVYNNHFTTTLTSQLKRYCLEISEIKTMKLTMKTPVEDISPKQLDNFYKKCDKHFSNKESLTAIYQFTSV